MAPKRRMALQAPVAEEPPTKAAKTQEQAAKPQRQPVAAAPQAASVASPQRHRAASQEGETAIVAKGPSAHDLVVAGGGRGIKATQQGKTQKYRSERADGTTDDGDIDYKEQVLQDHRTGKHVQTKSVLKENKTTKKTNGTRTVTQTVTIKKVSYL